MQELYPLTFKTIFKDKLWGGEKIQTILGKDFSPLPNCGETWEISGVKGNVSVVENGALVGTSLRTLIETYKGKLLGERVYRKFGNEFPLLVKFIDANADLSIQVHPDDELARERHDSFGKSEMWYIFQADPGSQLIAGFNRELDKDTYVDYFESGRLTEILNHEEVEADDVFYLPAGRVHTIGKGLLLAEIQQTSDITYRIYDFDRVDAAGNKRELHVEEALDAIDYNFYPEYKTNYTPEQNSANTIVESPYFSTQRLHCTQPIKRDYSDLDSFVILVCVGGTLEIKYEGGNLYMKLGDAVLIPANIENLTLVPKGEFKLLESYIPQESKN